MLVLLLIISVVPIWGRPQAPGQPQAQQPQPAQQPQSQQHGVSTVSPIPIVSQSESVGGDGSFNFSYETGNGIHVQEGGYIKKSQLPQGRNTALNANGSQYIEDENVQVITGAFSYTAPDGTAISLKYIADENGFQPEGAHLPTAPPIPPEIQKALSLQPKTPQQRSLEPDQYLGSQPQQQPVDATSAPSSNIEQHVTTNVEPHVTTIAPNADTAKP